MSSSRIPAPVRTSVPDHELLVEVLGRIPDPRRRRGVRHPVAALIAVAVCAVTAGARGFTAIGEWACDAGAAALTRLGLERGSVDESTLRRLFARLDADRLDALLGAWAAMRCARVAVRRVIAIDGKTVRGARDADASAPHLVAALAHGSGAVLGQVAVREKSNEITCHENHEGEHFTQSAFTVDWQARKVTCPEGKISASWSDQRKSSGTPVARVHFSARDCGSCPVREKCTKAANGKWGAV
ncbi:ISAs1 family transposase [Streptomyces sp. NPDC046994]|uniref:ISAs1 family transposase n=1 Tax=Streptomyces sp. NPDC046994 TaxID=3155735 RepID=UPI003454E0BB